MCLVASRKLREKSPSYFLVGACFLLASITLSLKKVLLNENGVLLYGGLNKAIGHWFIFSCKTRLSGGGSFK